MPLRKPIDDHAFATILRDARTHNAWTDTPVPDELLHRIWEDARMGPTSANCSPIRVVFVRSAEAKEKLRPALMSGNVEKTMKAPVTAIIAHDMEFHEHLPFLFPHTDAKSWFTGSPELIEETAFRNGTLQGAYLMLAARAHGLDCGPMSGFDKGKVDEAFFAGTSWRSNWLCNLGVGDDSQLFPRSPRFAFDQACRIL